MKKILLIICFLSFACTNTNISKQEDILQIDESQAQNLIKLSIDCVDKKLISNISEYNTRYTATQIVVINKSVCLII